MFPEYRALISQLKTTHPRFQALFEKHNDLDHQITRIENGEGQGYGQQLVTLKKEKLQIKDELYKILQQESQHSS
ncbi:YdcH family protein [Pluralibacter gergoviae]|uniref:YdcH family protein n=1 Tax=Pluralibacter gergoviae TaxID=61647 RepID=UPI0008DC23A3|nr:YdcH family protein [Pluralibacter gergoviae]EKW6620035.1 YdcH family protein [Pluralibacter gergoviae]OHY64464.1 hypothetical protein BB778_20805 [Pluralibacter gergoviae]